MKPIHLNLASRPYRDNRPLYAVVVVTSLIIAFLALTNFDTWYRYRHETRATRAKIEQIDAAAAQERNRAEVVKRQIGSLDLVKLERQTEFVNAKLAERAFSWSDLLNQLEKILIDDVRVVSIAPNVDKNGNVILHLVFEAKASDGLVTTMERFNKHPQFSNPFPTSENLENGIYRYDFNVQYVPAAPKVVSQ